MIGLECHLATFLCIFDKVAFWPQLISYLLVAPACLHAASDWPCTFLHPRCFCSVINIVEAFDVGRQVKEVFIVGESLLRNYCEFYKHFGIYSSTV